MLSHKQLFLIAMVFLSSKSRLKIEVIKSTKAACGDNIRLEGTAILHAYILHIYTTYIYIYITCIYYSDGLRELDIAA